ITPCTRPTWRRYRASNAAVSPPRQARTRAWSSSTAGAEAGIRAVTMVVSIVLGMCRGGRGFKAAMVGSGVAAGACAEVSATQGASRAATWWKAVFRGNRSAQCGSGGAERAPDPVGGLKSPAVFASLREPALSTTRPVSIKQEDLIQSVADALQYISYYHPVDYIRNLAAAHERKESPAAKDAIAQILINSPMCAEGHRPICQDTGIITVFLEIGLDVRWDDRSEERRVGEERG